MTSQSDNPLGDNKPNPKVSRWLETQRGRPQYRPAPHAAKVVARIMRPLSKKHGGGHTALAQNWTQIVGDRFGKFSRPVKFLGGKDGRTLVVSAPGPAAALIMASSATLIEQVNGFLGPNHIRHIKVIQTQLQVRSKDEVRSRPTSQGLSPIANDQLQSGLENISSPELKAVLENLGRKVMSGSDKL